MSDPNPFCRNGGLTIVPLPGLEGLASSLKVAIEGLDPTKYTRTPVDIATPGFDTYAGTETFFRRSNTHIVEHDCMVLGTGPMSDAMLMKLIWTVGMLAGRHAGRITILTGYFPHSRSDKDEGDDILTTLPILHDAIKGVAGPTGVHRWICFDPHSDQITSTGRSGLVTPVLLTRKLLRFCLEKAASEMTGEKNIVLGFPDASAEKRYRSAMKAIEKETSKKPKRVVINKERQGGVTKILNISGDVDAVPGSHLLMFDDEVASGSSSLQMAKAMKQDYGARKVMVCATHAVMCSGAPAKFLNQAEMLGGQWVDHLVFADTVPVGIRVGMQKLIDSGRMSIYYALSDLAQVIYRHHWGKGIRQLR